MASSGMHVNESDNANRREKIRPKLFKRKKKNSELSEIKSLYEQYGTIDPSNIKCFSDFPLSLNTLTGLIETHYIIPTDIQKQCIGPILQGRDVCGTAHTGSGKTLAFVIPVLEILFCKQWTQLDGPGALIITPTRELAYQIFECLKAVGKHHNLSAGLIIGGKDLHFEMRRMSRCNIIIGTPGRILHHMDVNPNLITTSLKIFVIDEADKCMDFGFEETMMHIVDNLPADRQTLLFSATQKRSVGKLANLSLRNPEYIFVHETKEHSTPDSLEQSYILCELHDKVSFLWSFIKNHRRQKILVFISTCKQVKYLYNLFCRLRPGSPLLALYGSLHQLRRMKIYNDFCSKQNVVMLATDIAARGLDFPNIDWVLQLDCPEDGNTYIHRAGRTARYKRGGENLLVLLPSEERAMIEELRSLRIPIYHVKTNPAKLVSPLRNIEALLARDADLKADAQRAFVAYVKWVYLMKNKRVFNIQSLDLERFAASLGLAVTPKVRFLKRKMAGNSSASKPKKVTRKQEEEEFEESSDESSGDDSDVEMESDENAMENNLELDGDHEDEEDEDEDDDDEDDHDDESILTIKRRDHEIDEVEPTNVTEIESTEIKPKKTTVTKAAVVKKMLKKKIVPNKKIVYDEEGQVVHNKVNDKFSKEALEYEMEDKGGIDIQKARKMLRAEDKFDKQWFRERVKEKHKKRKMKLKNKREENEEEMDDFGSDSDHGPDVGGTSPGNEDEFECGEDNSDADM